MLSLHLRLVTDCTFRLYFLTRCVPSCSVRILSEDSIFCFAWAKRCLWPSQSLYKSTNVTQVNIAANTGDMGILANHVPSVEPLRPGVVEVIETDGQSKKWFGMLQFMSVVDIADDSCHNCCGGFSQ